MKVLDNLKELLYKTNSSSKEKELTKSPLQLKAKRLLIIFFVTMFVLTICSRAADSITIAQVTVQSPQGSTLSFDAEGSGIITADANKYVRIPQGLIVRNFKVSAGQEVHKGDVLFSLDKKNLEDVLTLAKRDADKLADQVAQEKLSVTDPALSEQDSKRLSYQNAQKDLQNATNDYTDAKTTYHQLTAEYTKANDDYKQALTNSTAQIYEDKTQELKEAKASYDSVSLANDEALKNAMRTLNDSSDALQNLESKDTATTNYLNKYSNSYPSDSISYQAALEGLYSLAYGDEDSYEKHKDMVRDLQKKRDRAHDDYTCALKEYEKNRYFTDDPSSLSNTVTAAKRVYNDAEEDLDSENKKENKIKKEALNYISAIKSKDDTNKDQAALNIAQTIYGISGYEFHLKEVAKAKTKVAQSEDDLSSLKRKNAIALSSEQQKIDKIQRILDRIDNGTYDSKEAVQTQKQAVETCTQELKTQLQTVKTSKRAIDSARKALQSAKLDYEKSKKQDNLSSINLSKQERASRLRADALTLDLESKKQVVSELESIKRNNGNILSPVSGTIDSLNMEAGKATTTDNNLAINADGYGITVTIPKDQGEYVSIGDTIELMQKGKKDKIEVKAESIRFTKDAQGTDITQITAIMPEGEYILGATLDASINKNSDLYDICIPVSAVRNDVMGSYCLITQPRNTLLGEELLAVRKNIKVIDSDSVNAAIDDSLTNEDNVIVSSNKDINEGDRVRIK